ncbi:MAG: glycoside hydrolase family 15 protein [Sulfobacillus sp.]
MSRPIIIGNGHLTIGFDDTMAMRDLYFPHVGQWNHANGYPSRFGVQVDDSFSWVHDAKTWTVQQDYVPDTLVALTTLESPSLGVTLVIKDGVTISDNIWIRQVEIRNLSHSPREIRVFFHTDLSLGETEVGDTVLFNPELQALYHYKKNWHVVIGGNGPHSSMHQWSCGVKRFNGHEGTWRDAEDGRLEKNPIVQGSVDSVMSVRVTVPAMDHSQLYFWLVASDTRDAVETLHHKVLSISPGRLLERTESYWRHWLRRGHLPESVPEDVRNAYARSLVFCRAFGDHAGGIIAALDSDIMQYNRDHYAYVWPRDAALVALSMLDAGYPEVSRQYFSFAARTLSRRGYFYHKYNPDGSAGSSWHPWIQGEEPKLPIQTDETALVIFLFGKYLERTGDVDTVREYWESLIQPASVFLAHYVYPDLGLPKPSWDLWEERYGIFTWSTAATIGALRGAAVMAEALGEPMGQLFHDTAQSLTQGLERYLYSANLGHFLRGVSVDESELLDMDPTPDASIAAIRLFDIIGPTDHRSIATRRWLNAKLWVPTKIGGIARYQGDRYLSPPGSENIPGNPWIITTLWMADWAFQEGDRDTGVDYVQWALKQQHATGALPEQIHPFTGAPLSVAPLTWSHATMVAIIRRHSDKIHLPVRIVHAG